MCEEPIITSMQNKRVKHVVALQQKSSLRRSEGRFVVEGRRELQHCLEAGYEVEELYWTADIDGEFPQEIQQKLSSGDVRAEQKVSSVDVKIGQKVSSGDVKAEQKSSPMVIQVSREVYEKMAYRGSTERVMAVVKARSISLEDLQMKPSPLLVVLESVEKPGNLGAILRSADAAGADAVIVCDPLTDLYNPNLIRASIGAIFSVPCVACSSEDCIRFLKARGIQILTAQLQDSHPYYATDMRRGTAIVMGTESTGLTDRWRVAADAHIRIPMLGMLDSLNVSVSAAILLYEAVRQRETLEAQKL